MSVKTIPDRLTDAILSLASANLTNTQIAERLGCSVYTVKAYRTRAKSEARTRRESGGLKPPDLRRKPIRCPTCRALVYPPCFACQLRAELESRDKAKGELHASEEETEK